MNGCLLLPPAVALSVGIVAAGARSTEHVAALGSFVGELAWMNVDNLGLTNAPREES